MICGRISYINVVFIDAENPRIGPNFGTQILFHESTFNHSVRSVLIHTKSDFLGDCSFQETISHFLGSDPVQRGSWMRPWILLGWHWTDAASV